MQTKEEFIKAKMKQHKSMQAPSPTELQRKYDDMDPTEFKDMLLRMIEK